mgnify:CR=1 FL=1
MAKSILSTERKCYLCGSQQMIEEHHIYSGALRKISEKHGFKVYLCHYCHNEPPNGVHFCKERNLLLKRQCQREYEKTHSRADFIRIIGRNYL